MDGLWSPLWRHFEVFCTYCDPQREPNEGWFYSRCFCSYIIVHGSLSSTHTLNLWSTLQKIHFFVGLAGIDYTFNPENFYETKCNFFRSRVAIVKGTWWSNYEMKWKCIWVQVVEIWRSCHVYSTDSLGESLGTGGRWSYTETSYDKEKEGKTKRKKSNKLS